MGNLESLEGKYEQEVLNNAYSSGYNYLNSERSFLEIAEQLKIDGFPEDLIHVVIEDLKIDKMKGLAELGKKHISYGLLSMAASILLFVGILVFFSRISMLPLLLFIIGIIFLVHGISKKKLSKSPQL